MAEWLIMRHAKSDWTGDFSDWERPLNRRGEEDARAMGKWLARQALAVGGIVSSSARRARQTAEAVALALGFAQGQIHFRDELYLAGRTTLVQIIEEMRRDDRGGLLLVGHNPGLDELVTWLSAGVLPHTPKGKLMTTAAVAIFRLPAGEPLKRGAGVLRFLARPRALREAGWPDLPS